MIGRHNTRGGWTDRYLTWLHELERRTDAADVLIALRIGSVLLLAAPRERTRTMLTTQGSGAPAG